MSASLGAGAAAKPWRWVRETGREWGWTHTAVGLAAGSLALFNMGSALFLPEGFEWGRAWTYNVLQFGLPMVFALRVADRAVDDGVPRLLAYGLAVMAVVLAGVWLFGPMLFPVLGGDPNWGFTDDVRLASSLLLPYSMATLGYVHWRGQRLAFARFQVAEQARAEQRRQAQAARLLALQARVEPQFLFDSLKLVRDRIGATASASPASEGLVSDSPGSDSPTVQTPAVESPASAARLLANVIALLRAMQPQAGASASSLARERTLVQAWAQAAEAPALLPPRLTWHVPAALGAARLAPMVLLPALRQLVGDAPQAQWCVQAVESAAAPGPAAPAPAAPMWRLRVFATDAAQAGVAALALDRLDLGPLLQAVQTVHGAQATVARVSGVAGPVPNASQGSNAASQASALTDTAQPAPRATGLVLEFQLPLQWSPADGPV